MGKTYRYDADETSQRRNQTEISRARARKIKNRDVLFERGKRKEILLKTEIINERRN
jgi:hypothetical protein